ncbi:MAG: hypothetical protein KGK18_16770 [Burkholderiales bacterium]|nr:hypothetical protein [Burkholderiales bacterium]
MDFNTFIGTAWHDHATEPAAVARRLGDGLALVADEPQLARLAELAHHVLGEHLGDWRAGIAFIEQLATLPAHAPDGVSGQALRRCACSLALSEGPGGAAARLDAMSPSDRIRVGAMAAANLAERDTGRARQLLQDALDQAERSGLGAADPMNRALAITGNNLACTLERKTARSPAERELMILAAQAARRYWERAGTWLETERAEYRLAMTWLQAGEPARARAHARECLRIVADHDGAALERLFGWEALGHVEHAAGDMAAHVQALERAREAYAELDEADQAWCAPSLEALAARGAAPPVA